MTFTVLSDNDVKQILRTLTQSDTSTLVEALQNALVRYSCQGEQQYQPHRAVVSRPDGQVSLFMPATTEQSIGVKIVGIAPASKLTSSDPNVAPPPALRSALTLCDAEGQAIGVLNAAELTAFRTALGSMLLFRLRKNVENIVVFGAGKQALWHIRLAIILQGDKIKNITVVNRSQKRTQALFDDLCGEAEAPWPSHVSLKAFNDGTDDLQNLVQEADALFCTTPSTQPLFPAAFLSSEAARKKTRFISAIGSYRLDMAEIDPELLKDIVDPSGSFATQVWGGHISVDSRDGCLQEAGELVSAGIDPKKMLEVGNIFEEGKLGPAQTEWLESGFVIYKSVGVGVMDIAIGKALLELAHSKNVGVSMENF